MAITKKAMVSRLMKRIGDLHFDIKNTLESETTDILFASWKFEKDRETRRKAYRRRKRELKKKNEELKKEEWTNQFTFKVNN